MTYHCCVYSEKLLMIDRRTVQNMYSFISKTNFRISASIWFYYKNSDTNYFNLLAPELFFFNFSTSCIKNVNNTGTKYVRIMKQTAFLREKE